MTTNAAPINGDSRNGGNLTYTLFRQLAEQILKRRKTKKTKHRLSACGDNKQRTYSTVQKITITIQFKPLCMKSA